MNTLKSELVGQLASGFRGRNDRTVLIEEQFNDLLRKYGGLKLRRDEGSAVVSGRLCFKALYDGRSVKDCYDVEMRLPAEYPALPPRVREVGNNIPRDPDYHVSEDGTLCLGADLAVLERFYEKPELLWFVDELVVPHLAARSWERNDEVVPWPQLRHEGEGLLEFYKAYFHTNDDLAVLRLLKAIVRRKCDGRKPCPCGKGKKLARCHANILVRVSKYPIDFSREYRQVAAAVKQVAKPQTAPKAD